MSDRDLAAAADRPDRERLDPLLVLRATEGLDPESWEELEPLLESLPEEETESWELAAAWVDLALAEAHECETEPLPPHLRRRIAVEGRLTVRSFRGREETLHAAPQSSPPLRPSAPKKSSAGQHRLWGYAASAAAGVALALWLNAEPPRSPERGYRALVASQADVREVPFASQPGTGVDGLVGSVVWSDAAQAGYLRLEGLPVNDPNERQYQLWIVDPDVGEQPVDGGVFDITSEGLNTVAIDAKLAVRQPTLFVITTEQPGGVVVSDGPFQAVATFES